jgi:hypothetical protein
MFKPVVLTVASIPVETWIREQLHSAAMITVMRKDG